jgi:rhodanese-related sulfurtransferase
MDWFRQDRKFRRFNLMFGFLKSKTRSIKVSEVQQRLDDGAQLIDVRESNEWKSGHAPGANHIPLGSLEGRLKTIAKERPVMVMCQSGMRSAQAAKILASEGFDVSNVSGGMVAWKRAGLRTV